MCIDRKEAVFS